MQSVHSPVYKSGPVSRGKQGITWRGAEPQTSATVLPLLEPAVRVQEQAPTETQGTGAGPCEIDSPLMDPMLLPSGAPGKKKGKGLGSHAPGEVQGNALEGEARVGSMGQSGPLGAHQGTRTHRLLVPRQDGAWHKTGPPWT
ncbi:hypothetical protein NDU88_002722 [Pleurodeles waltl]|uniref:Uncharacterized protein n=1 Tax=Pleurodeles waltl TaxID=8319 RepID=A0AAV7TP33_PLEWA|nr:hypothetical protein NDU88_002722 [Pleurodeles waltl]